MDMLKKIVSKAWLRLAKVSLIIGLCASYLVTPFPYTITIELRSQATSNLQIFYSSNGRYLEKNSISLPVSKSNTFKAYAAKLIYKNIRFIRIDPPGDFQIKLVKIENRFNTYEYNSLDLLNHIRPLNHFSEIDISEGVIVGKVNGDDPYFEITDLPVINRFSKFSYAVFLVVTFFIFYTLISILWNRYLKYDFLTPDHDRMNINIPDTLFSVLIISIFFWFGYQAFYYATHIAEHISPDESYHLQVSLFHMRSPTFFIKDSPETYAYGAISVRPYLFHFLMSKLLVLNVFNISNLIFLRLTNILIGLLSLYLTFLLTKEVTKNRWIQLGVLIVQTNILMFVFLASMISYDNLVNLISVASFLFLIRFLRTFSRYNLMMLFITMLAGSLTKVAYPPIVIIQLFILIAYSKAIYRNRQKIFYPSLSIQDGVLLLSLIVLFTLNLKLYGHNVITYGQVQPKSSKVFGHEKAYRYYSQSQRDYDLRSTVKERTMLPFTVYLFNYVIRTEQSILGIVGHKQLVKTNHGLFLYRFLVLLSVFLFALNYKKTFKHSTMKILMVSFISYALIVLFTNYQSYHALRLFGLALQGRYNFPIFALVDIFIVYNLLAQFRDLTKIVALTIITVLLVYNNFFWFLMKATPEWYMN